MRFKNTVQYSLYTGLFLLLSLLSVSCELFNNRAIVTIKFKSKGYTASFTPQPVHRRCTQTVHSNKKVIAYVSTGTRTDEETRYIANGDEVEAIFIVTWWGSDPYNIEIGVEELSVDITLDDDATLPTIISTDTHELSIEKKISVSPDENKEYSLEFISMGFDFNTDICTVVYELEEK